MKKMNALIDEFIRGRQNNISKENEDYVNGMRYQLKMYEDWSFLDQSGQKCANLFIRVSFQGMDVTWNQIEDGIMGPSLYHTDFGSCCVLVPHIGNKIF